MSGRDDTPPALLGLDRFPARAYLAGLARGHRPIREAPSVADSYAEHVVARWAELVGVSPGDLVVFATEAEALRVVSGALLAPGDVALLAEPAPIGLPAAVLSVGGRYVDLGRNQRGAINPDAAARAIAGHPEAILWAGAPALSGVDDTALIADRVADRPRATLQDSRLHGGLTGPGAPGAGALARVVALRDPDDPAAPLLHAVIAGSGTGWALTAVRGPAALPLPLLRRALDALDVIAADPAGRRAAHQRWLADAHAALAADLPEKPGLIALAPAGHARALRCLGDDGAEIAQTLQRRGWSAAAFAAHPMQGLIVVDVAGSQAAIAERA